MLIKNIRIHPDYKPPISYYDIALIELSRPVNSRTAFLHTDSELLQTNFYAIGWGKTESFGPYPVNLQSVTLEHNSESVCEKIYRNSSKRKLPHGLRTDIQICAGGEIGRDTCEVSNFTDNGIIPRYIF